MDVWGKEDEVKEGGEEKAEESLVPGGAPPEPPYLLPPPEKKEGEEDPKPGGFDIKIFRLAASMITKTARKSPKPPWTSSSNSRWTASTSVGSIRIGVTNSLAFSCAGSYTWRRSSSEWTCGGGSQKSQDTDSSAA